MEYSPPDRLCQDTLFQRYKGIIEVAASFRNRLLQLLVELNYRSGFPNLLKITIKEIEHRKAT